METMTVILNKSYRPLGQNTLFAANAVLDLPIEEAATVIAKHVATETVPSDPAKARKWVKELTDKAVERAMRHSDTYRKLYLGDFRRYAEWCSKQGIHALPVTVETLVRYVLYRANEGVSEFTIRRDIAGITAIHGLTPHPPVAWFLSQSALRTYGKMIVFAREAMGNERGTAALARENTIRKAYEMFGSTGSMEEWGHDVAA